MSAVAFVYTSVFLFIIKLRFPKGKLIADIVRKRYRSTNLSEIHKFEKLDYGYCKTKLNLGFLQECQTESIIPKFLQFKTANNRLRSSNTCYQKKLV